MEPLTGTLPCAITLQATTLVEALRTVDWDSAFYSLTGSNNSDEGSSLAQACKTSHIVLSCLLQHGPYACEQTWSWLPTCSKRW